MNILLLEEHPYLLHEVGTRYRPGTLCIHLADRDDAFLDLVCPGSKNVTQLSRAGLHRVTVLVERTMSPDGPL